MPDDTPLVPVTVPNGRPLALDFPGLRVGTAEYAEGPTGCTVLHFPRPAACVMDIRGGAPGIIGGYDWVDAICFAGGSVYGLEAAAGVSDAILQVRQHRTGWDSLATVSGAIIYDFAGRTNAVYPDKRLGRAAFEAAREGQFPIGACGAGRSASVGKLPNTGRFTSEPGGQGGAFLALGALRFAVFTVVNSMGVILDEAGRVALGMKERRTGVRSTLREILDRHPELATVRPARGNTTLTAVVVNIRLDRQELRQLARQVHAAMARVIRPFHTEYDGDVRFALSTEAVAAPEMSRMAVGEYCADLACEAVWSLLGDRTRHPGAVGA
jgi:L-aminopeptidase/D-esterase-like protein